ELSVLGRCAPGVQAVQADDGDLVSSDNPHYSTAPFVDASNPAYTGNLTALPLQAVLVKVNDPATLERVRTFLAVHAPPQISTGSGVGGTPPRTYGWEVAIRSRRDTLVQGYILFVVTVFQL